MKRQTSSLSIYGETGRFPLIMRQQDRAVKLWIRLKFSIENKPINHVFNELMTLHCKGHKTWLTKIQSILGDTYYSMPNKLSLKQYTCQLKETRYKQYIEKWNIDINDSAANPILRTYRIFKTDFGKEAYFSLVSKRNFLTAIARFMTSSHSLHIEKGRHTIPTTPIENRKCLFCLLNKVDDEFHMLLECDFS